MKQLLKDFLHAYATGDKEGIASKISEQTTLSSNMIGSATGKTIIKALELPMEDINTTVITITNYLEQDQYCLATFHHLHAIDYDNMLYPFLYGGKIFLRVMDNVIQDIKMDLEYEFGNTYIMNHHWDLYEACKTQRTITGKELQPYSIHVEEAIYKCFLAMDLENEELFKANVSDDIRIHRTGVNGDVYTLDGKQDIKAFLKKDKGYYDQNQYSLHLHEISKIDELQTHVIAWHLSPGKPGNKHMASHTKYVQFYDEIMDIMLVKEQEFYKVKSIVFKRKENPVMYGYDSIEL